MTWKDAMGVADSTTRVLIYCDEDDNEEWKQEVDEHAYKSLSTYLFELIHESRAYRADGFLSHQQSEQRIEELEETVEQLEQQLAKKEQRDGGQVHIDDPEFLYRFIDTHPKSLVDILKSIVESGALNDLIRKPIEEQLYFLASQDQIAYSHGHGWKLTGGDE